VSAGVVVVAGGRGVRVGGGVPKQFLEIAGEPVLLRAARPFLDHPRIDSVVVVLPEAIAESPPGWLAGLDLRIVAGGAERGDSVWNGLQALPDGVDRVLVHDGARPFVDAALIDRVLDACARDGAIAAVRVTDTVKEVGGDGVIVATPDRARLWRAQTPQGFPRDALTEAYRRARAEGVSATDDAAVFERCGWRVRVVEGSERNIKVTVPEDLALAERLALAPSSAPGE
jgi:2-C-methyl-D-erythritol 4-phosphate cytidylyltransferase